MGTQIEAVLWGYAGVFTNSPFEAPPEHSVFLDDHPGNVAAARSLGMHGILVERDPSGAMKALSALLA